MGNDNKIGFVYITMTKPGAEGEGEGQELLEDVGPRGPGPQPLMTSGVSTSPLPDDGAVSLPPSVAWHL